VARVVSSFLKNLKQSGYVAPLLTHYFSAGSFPDEMPLTIGLNKERDSALHPSSDSLGCARTMYVRRQAPPERHSGDLQRIFQIGHLYHAWIQHIVCHELELCDPSAVEREFRGTLCGQVADNSLDWRTDPVIQNSIGWMRGFADIVPVEIPGKGNILVDIKTAASFKFKDVPVDDATWEKYHAQCQLYMDWFDTDVAVVLYINKDSPHAFKERVVKRDSKFVDAIYAKWLVVAEAEQAGVAPECDEGCCH
jgi:hypothetical protein